MHEMQSNVTTRALPEITTAELDEFEAQGFVRLGRVAGAAEIDALCGRIDDIMLGHLANDDMFMQASPTAGPGTNPSSLSYRKIEDLERDPLFRAYLQRPEFRHIARRLIGEQVAVFRAMFFNKPAQGSEPLGWHNDGRSWRLSTKERFSIYTALDPATPENGCLQLVPRSHRTPHPETLDTAELIDRYAPPESRVFVELAKGEVLLFHINLLHHSAANQTSSARRAFSVAYIDGNAWQAATGRLFPLVWPQYVPAEQRNAGLLPSRDKLA